MKRAAATVGVFSLMAVPVAAQWAGAPAWNSPKGGTGVTIYADYTKPNTEGGKGYGYAGRVALGLATVTLTAGVASWEPSDFDAHVLSYGGTAEFRLIGGSLLPVAVNVQLGAAHNPRVRFGLDTVYQTTTAQAAVGFSVPLPTPGFSIEPYFSPGVRFHQYWNVGPGVSKHDFNFGWVVGGNFGFGPFAIHLAYDSEKFNLGPGPSHGPATHGVFGVGAHVSLKMPMGM